MTWHAQWYAVHRAIAFGEKFLGWHEPAIRTRILSGGPVDEKELCYTSTVLPPEGRVQI